MASNLITLISASTMNTLKTENVLFDIMMSMFFIFLVHECMNNNFQRLKSFKRWLFRTSESDTTYEHEIVCRIYKKEDSIRHYFTKSYVSLIDYLIENKFIHKYSELSRCSYEDEDDLKLPIDSSFDISKDIRCVIITQGEPEVERIRIKLESKKSLEFIDEFIEKTIQLHKEKLSSVVKNNQFYFFPMCEVNNKKIDWSIYRYKTNKTWDHVFFENKEQILHKINNFMNHPEIYQKQGTPWTLGMLLYGKPGTGKTSFIKALASQTKRHLIEIPLNEIQTYEQLKKLFFKENIKNMHVPFEKRIYLIEDIDCLNENLICKRTENKDSKIVSSSKISYSESRNNLFTSKDKITLSHLLNVIDGAIEVPGRILIMTSNHPEKIDPALLREGRIDIKIEMKPIQGEILKYMIQKWYPNVNMEDKTFANKQMYTPAEIENMCLSMDFKEIYEYIQ
jgi:SpoVK/Ycf46/Vps4 family AAA+-type ATPase